MGSHPSQKRYPPELKDRTVRMARDAIAEQGGQAFGVVPRIARQLGVGVESLRGWLAQAEIDGGHRPGTSTTDAQRIAELESEVRELHTSTWPHRGRAPRMMAQPPINAPDGFGLDGSGPSPVARAIVAGLKGHTEIVE